MVAKNFTQIYGIDYSGIFFVVASLRIFRYITIKLGWITVTNVSSALLYDKLTQVKQKYHQETLLKGRSAYISLKKSSQVKPLSLAQYILKSSC